jgi:hypothetical protein
MRAVDPVIRSQCCQLALATSSRRWDPVDGQVSRLCWVSGCRCHCTLSFVSSCILPFVSISCSHSGPKRTMRRQNMISIRQNEAGAVRRQQHQTSACVRTVVCRMHTPAVPLMPADFAWPRWQINGLDLPTMFTILCTPAPLFCALLRCLPAAAVTSAKHRN